MRGWSLFGLMLLVALPGRSRADCGDEVWATAPTDLAARLPYDAQAVLTVGLPLGSPTIFFTYVRAGAGWGRGRAISASEFVPVSREPSCDRERQPLEGERYPVTRSSGAFVEVMFNVKTGDTAWLRAKDFKPYVVDLSSITPGSYFTTALDPANGHDIRVYPLPAETDVFTVLPGAGLLIKVEEQSGDFVLLKHARWNPEKGKWESGNIGWIRLRSLEGKLLLWPWYYDDC